MRLLLTTAYFPNVHYFSLLKRSGGAVMDLGEHFVKQTYRNRAIILGANGPLKLIVPLQKWKNNTAVCDLRISYSDDWQKQHWRSMESAYRNSPYFEYYEEKLAVALRDRRFEFLCELNQAVLEVLMDILRLKTPVEYSRDYIGEWEAGVDMRAEIHRKEPDTSGFAPYEQVFSNRTTFIPNLSTLDLICNEGPNALHLLP